MNANDQETTDFRYLDCGHGISSDADIGGTDAITGSVVCRECFKTCQGPGCGRGLSPAHQYRVDDNVFCPRCSFKIKVVSVVGLIMKVIYRLVKLMVDGVCYWIARIFKGVGL